jgi:hypothetical protein
MGHDIETSLTSHRCHVFIFVIPVVFMSVLRKLSTTNLAYGQFQFILLCFNESWFSDLSHNEIAGLVEGTFIGMPRLSYL